MSLNGQTSSFSNKHITGKIRKKDHQQIFPPQATINGSSLIQTSPVIQSFSVTTKNRDST